MELTCLGINHRTAPVETREKMWFSTDEAKAFLAALRQEHARECVLVSTCNRTELYYVPDARHPDPWEVWEMFTKSKLGDEPIGRDHFYMIPSLHAARNLFNVVGAIDSMVLGDVQIINQVKESFQVSSDLRVTGPILNRLFSNALHIGKRVRTETEIGEGAISVSYAAAELAGKIFEDLSKRTAMLVGAGETGELAAKHLCSKNLGKLKIANRTRQRAETLANELHGEVVDFAAFKESIKDVDILVSSVNIDGYLLTSDELKQAMRGRGGRPLVIIDIGVPRNIDPKAKSLDLVFLHDIDALNHIIDNNLAHRQSEVPKVHAIVLDELTKFNQWHATLEVAPTIELLRIQFENIRKEELEKHKGKFPADKQEELELLTHRIVNKILHAPMVNLRDNSAHSERDQISNKLSLVRYLFGLDKSSSK